MALRKVWPDFHQERVTKVSLLTFELKVDINYMETLNVINIVKS